jgi:hypothetical protein
VDRSECLLAGHVHLADRLKSRTVRRGALQSHRREGRPLAPGQLTATAVTGALEAAVSTPAYVLGRIGLLMLGSSVLFIPAIFVLALGFTLQAGATGAVEAIKMSAHLVAGGAGTSEIAVGADARRGAPPS